MRALLLGTEIDPAIAANTTLAIKTNLVNFIA
jgi:hypothetical protein